MLEKCWQEVWKSGTAPGSEIDGGKGGEDRSATFLCRGSFGLGAKSSTSDGDPRGCAQTGAATLWPQVCC